MGKIKEITTIPIGEKSNSPIQILDAISLGTKDLLDQGILTYDSYMRLVIDNMAHADSNFLAGRIRATVGDFYNDVSKPETWKIANDYIEKIQDINYDYVSLLLDPGISLRFDGFYKYAQRH